ncbi:MAG: type II toxin-antitoxin system VapC family toxin [Planctomycetota bacterium]|nr:type II toxin-antitoxin system VapC family toxin [Planctomycetota bacterium]MDA1138431.1 type II toxin-antitoxin system VapC family toxin [Planctomycetota bacterium]
MRFLLDTNVISELRKRRPSRPVQNWLLQNESSCAICELVIGELIKGAYRLAPGDLRAQTIDWINAVEEQFEDKTLSLDLAVLKRWGELCGESLRMGRKLSVMDSLIAATALTHSLIIVTRNTGDFPSGVPTLNPW